MVAQSGLGRVREAWRRWDWTLQQKTLRSVSHVCSAACGSRDLVLSVSLGHSQLPHFLSLLPPPGPSLALHSPPRAMSSGFLFFLRPWPWLGGSKFWHGPRHPRPRTPPRGPRGGCLSQLPLPRARSPCPTAVTLARASSSQPGAGSGRRSSWETDSGSLPVRRVPHPGAHVWRARARSPGGAWGPCP